MRRTSTVAITSFEFAGGGAEFGAIVPLPGIPSEVEKGGDWTLQRLVREVAPPQEVALSTVADGAARARSAEVLQEVRSTRSTSRSSRAGATRSGGGRRTTASP